MDENFFTNTDETDPFRSRLFIIVSGLEEGSFVQRAQPTKMITSSELLETNFASAHISIPSECYD